MTMFAYEFAKALGRDGVPQGFMTMSSGRGGRSRQLASPLSWTSFRGVKDIRNPAFKGRLKELFLQYPGTAVAKQAMSKHILDVKSFVAKIINGEEQGKDPSTFALQAPAFPEAGRGDDIASDTIPTYAYNWNVSPLTPMGVAGVIWVPSESNIGENPLPVSKDTYATCFESGDHDGEIIGSVLLRSICSFEPSASATISLNNERSFERSSVT